MIISATSFFAQLQDALNTIWNVEERENGHWTWFIKKRLLSFAMIMGIGVGVCVSMGVRMHGCRIFAAHAELRCGNAGARDAFDPHVVGRNRQAAQRAADVVERYAGIDQRTEQHVTRRPRKAVQIERLHVWSILSGRSRRRRSSPFPDSSSE